MTIEDVYKKYDSVLYPQMYSLALVKDFMKKTFDMAVKDCNEYYQNELDEVYKNYADRLKDVLKENEKLKIKVAYRHEVQTMLEKRVAELEAQIEKMKCCGNCAKNGHICVAEEMQGKLCGKNKDKWELRR